LKCRQRRFRIAEVASIRRPDSSDAGSPYIDAQCVNTNDFPAIERARHAVAHLTFILRGLVGNCTGTLVADQSESRTPYLLTAEHCINADAPAASVQAYFDAYPPACGAPAPDWSDFPSVVGATLVAIAPPSDASLLRLSAVPEGRTFLHIDSRSEAVAPGTHVFHLTHPDSENGVHLQVFTESAIDAAEPACWAPGYAFGSSAIRGAIGPGSSGGTVLTADGSIVGLSVSSCGDATGPESSTTHVVESLMRPTAAKFGPFLAPSPRRRSVGH
jgi:hypothetical protein